MYRDASPLLPVDPEELQIIDSNTMFDKTDFEIPTFRYTY